MQAKKRTFTHTSNDPRHDLRKFTIHKDGSVSYRYWSSVSRKLIVGARLRHLSREEFALLGSPKRLADAGRWENFGHVGADAPWALKFETRQSALWPELPTSTKTRTFSDLQTLAKVVGPAAAWLLCANAPCSQELTDVRTGRRVRVSVDELGVATVAGVKS